MRILGFLFITQRLRRANFTWDMEVIGVIAGYPMFAYRSGARSERIGKATYHGRDGYIHSLQPRQGCETNN